MSAVGQRTALTIEIDKLQILAAGSIRGGGYVRQIIRAAARQRIGRAAARCAGIACAAIDAARGQSLAMNGFGQNSGDLLRKGAMISRGTAP
jgi:hypothetical protein